MQIEDRNTNWHHQVTLIDRESMAVEGVINLGSFDEHEIIMETELGILAVKGSDLNIKNLNLEQGCIQIEGIIKSLVYEDGSRTKKGLLERLLK